MSFSDYLKGPAHRKRAEALEAQFAELLVQHSQLQELVTKIGAMDVVDIQKLIEQEQARLAVVREETQRSERELAALAQRSTDLQGQILVWEETLLLESFALYEPKFKLTTSQEYKARLDHIRDRQKVLIKNGQAASGNTNWTVNNSQTQGRKLVNDMIKLVIRSFNNEADACVVVNSSRTRF